MVEKKFKLDPKVRFSSRVENYIKYRPRYPQEIIQFLTQKGILSKNSIIADIGSGTGILSKLFLDNGNTVYGVEPNVDMRKASEKILGEYKNFISIEGSAESTSLKEDSIDLITAGQAFHWFNIEESRKEFKRILKPEGYVVLIWNRRKTLESEFLKDYEKLLLKYGTDYKMIEERKLEFKKFFGINQLAKSYKKIAFNNFQIFNYEGLRGRLLSTSYIPLNDHPNYKDMIRELKQLFENHEKQGEITFEYETEVYYGHLR